MVLNLIREVTLEAKLLREEKETVKQNFVDEKNMLESGENDCNTVHIADQHTQSNSKKNDQATANTSTTIIRENTAYTGQETSQKFLRIESNDTNMMESTRPENNRTSLNMIALAYNSDEEIDTSENKCDKTDETENQSTIPINQTNVLQQYRTITVSSSSEETDSENESISSSSESSSSDKSSDSSDSDSDTITEAKEKNNKSKKKGDKVHIAKKSKKIKNEFDELPPIEDLQINVSEDLCHLFGEIDKIVEQMVIVKPQPGKPTLNLETVLFLDKGQRTLGKIFDVFGSVSEPYYCIRFNNFEHIKQNNIEAGISVYYCPETEHTFLVFLHELTKIRGCDAVGDDEPPEFSDDEEEQAYYQKLNQKNGSAESTADNSTPCKRQRMSGRSQKSKHGWQSNHPWNRNAQSQRDEKQLFPRNSNRFNRKYYNDRQQECAYQSNAYWHSGPHLTSNRLHPGYDMSQYYQGQPNFQIHNMHQYPRYASGLSPSLINSQFANAPLSRNMVPYPTYVQLPMSTHVTTPWPSPSVTRRLLSVPPPPGDSPPGDSPPPSPSSSSFSSLSSSVLSPSILPSSSSSMFSLPPSTKTTDSNRDTTRSD